MTPTNVDLRYATRANAARIADILLKSRATFLPYGSSPHREQEVRAWVHDTLLLREHVTVAAVEGKVVGIMAMHRADGISWISQLYPDPSCVGQGIGSCLLAQAFATAARPIRLYTFQQNTGARRFCERHGFVPLQFTDGSRNEARCPDVLYELAG